MVLRLTVAVCFTLDVPAVMLYVSLRAQSYDAGRSTLHRIIASYRAFLGESPTTITLEYNDLSYWLVEADIPKPLLKPTG